MHFDIHWDDKFKTGHPSIDFQHRVFFDLLQNFAAEVKQGSNPTALRRLAIELYKFADFHFFSEENIMLKIGYPEFAHHHDLHQALLHELRSYIEALAVEAPRGEDMLDFLTKWFVSHTASEDLKLAVYVRTF